MSGPTAADMVREFHEKFFLPLSDTPRQPGLTLSRERHRMLLSEVAELGEAALEGGLPDIAQELADVAYVTYGTALTYGIDLDAVIAEVHAANMTKMGRDGRPIMVNGKVQKGPDYRHPDVASVLARQVTEPTDGPKYASWHRLKVWAYIGSAAAPVLHYELKHTPECDRLAYGQQCALDQYGNDRIGWPDEPGEYTIAAWVARSWTDSGWEYDSGVDWGVADAHAAVS